MNELSTIDFHGSQLVTVDHDGQPYVAMKPIVEAMGISWKTQHRKVTSDSKYGHMTMEVSGRAMSCVPLRKLNGWLFSINPRKVRPTLREAVELYQEECFAVLYDYWHNGGAINPRANDSELEALTTTVKQLQSEAKRLSTIRDRVAPASQFGDVSEETGRRKLNLVRSYFRSDNRKSIPTKEVQLLLDLSYGPFDDEEGGAE